MSNITTTFSKIGFILAAAGSAVGLGNLWRFPYLMANYGGGNFVLLYIIFTLTIGFFLMLAEFTLGRYLENPVVENVKKLKYNNFFSKAIFLFALVSLTIVSFYFVVAGWTLYYFGATITGAINYHLQAPSYYGGIFTNLLSSPLLLVFLTMSFILITASINYKGISNGVEKINNIFLPLLFVLIIVMIIKVLLLDGAMQGLKYFVSFDLSTIDSKTIFAALGQSFFSLSLASGPLLIYASYTKKNTSLVLSAKSTVLLDLGVSMLASALIIPAVFAFSYELNEGAGLAFVTIPAAFSNMSLGVIFASFFFFVLFIATLTSTVSLIEAILPFISSLFKINRNKSLIIVVAIAIILATTQSLSFGPLNNIKILGLPMFDFIADYLTNFLFIFSSILLCVMVGFGIKKEDLIKEITNNGKVPFRLFNTWYFSIKYILPIITTFIILNALI